MTAERETDFNSVLIILPKFESDTKKSIQFSLVVYCFLFF